MAKLGFRRAVSDSGVFILTSSEGPSVIVIIYVDDAIFMGPDRNTVTKAKESFMALWECRDLGETSEFLQMRIRQQGTAITLDQVNYLRKVLAHFGFVNQKHAATPLPSGFEPEANTSSPDPLLKQEYQEKVGSLLYLMIGTRPDISYTITKMSQFAANPSRRHLDAVNHICHYLMGTADYKLIYGNVPEGLIAYADADWAGTKTR